MIVFPTCNSDSSSIKEKVELEIIRFFQKNNGKIINGKGFEIPLEKFLDETIRKKDIGTPQDRLKTILIVAAGLLALLAGLLVFFLRSTNG